jgi:hypothetical protein
VVTGSFNWSWSAEHVNDENLLAIHDGRLANHYLQEFMARYEEAGGTDSLAVDAVAHVQPSELEVAVSPVPWAGMPRLVVRAEGIQTAEIHDLGGRLVCRAVNSGGPNEIVMTTPGLRAGAYVVTARGWRSRGSRGTVYLGR